MEDSGGNFPPCWHAWANFHTSVVFSLCQHLSGFNEGFTSQAELLGKTLLCIVALTQTVMSCTYIGIVYITTVCRCMCMCPFKRWTTVILTIMHFVGGY